MTALQCRSCGSGRLHTVCDLGLSPLSNAFVTADRLDCGEMFYPLHAFVCADCFLVQLAEFESPQAIFGDDYAYFSSYSDSWLAHARAYAERMTREMALGPASQVVEIASNDGYLLKAFRALDVPVLGIEPARNVAAAAQAAGVPTVVDFFGTRVARALAAEGVGADLLIGNNVLAHVPDINDFVGGMAVLLKPAGTVTMEFPHVMHLVEQGQFDTIYHEHFSYLSLTAVKTLFHRHGLRVHDVEELSTHGGSLRIHASHAAAARPEAPAVAQVLAAERAAGLCDLTTYASFRARVYEIRRGFVGFLMEAKASGATVAAYGAAAKGNTLLNYCGVRADMVDYVADRSTFKQGRFLPGTRIPVVPPERIAETRPDYVVILPWNLKDEIAGQLEHVRSWGGRFVVPVPRLEVF